MDSTFHEPPAATTPWWWRMIKRHVSTVLFLLLATTGMMLTYWYFTPVVDEETAAAAIAPNSNPLPARQVYQRFAQSQPPLNVAIIVGHRNSDPGAVCDDGLTELAVNTTIAEKVLLRLADLGYSATLFDEFDERLAGYDGTALISIHADSCGDYGETATGYKMAGSSRTDSTQLMACLDEAYARATGLSVHANTITTHMTDYHAFRKIALGTPALIIETGFLREDRALLTLEVDRPATGIAEGIVCFLESR